MAMRANPLLIVTVLLAVAGAALAQAERAGSSGNAQLLRQIQQLASERTQLQAENARLQKELDAARKERESLKGEGAGLDRRLKVLQASAARAEEQSAASAQELSSQRARMEELVARFRETANALREVETERASVAQSLAVREQELVQCHDRNQKLYSLNDEILTHFGKQGFWSGLARAEPFTRLKRVQLDNLIGEYRAKAEDHTEPKPAR